MFNHNSLIPWGSFRGRQEEKWGSFRGRDHFGGCTELLNNIYMLAQNPFLAVFNEETQFLVSARN